jgi:hypothetical protein
MFAEIEPQGKIAALANCANLLRNSCRATRRKRVSTAAACDQTESGSQNTGACCQCATVLTQARQSRPDSDFCLIFKAFAELI